MNEIIDKRLKAIANGHELHGNLEHLNIMEHEITQMATELLSRRSLNKRLVEDAITLAHQVKLVNDWELDVVEDATSRYWEEILDQHTALMKEIRG